ncbi:MAG: DUF2652 domain-containing protein [Acidimicrobiia bacterium]|nr:DUF2652 domain-containing protein [Acidimicrobiia bacterium]
MAENGFIFIADISGYTSYLHGSELEHAQGTLTDLLELLIDRTTHPLTISRLEGDAVISYALDVDQISGQTFLEMIEDTYIAFRRAIDLMVLNNSCQCSACANVSNLDLKFFLHHGEYSFQHLGEFDELIGSDVNLIHRLTKNTVAEALDSRAYLLCTEAAVEALGMLEASAFMTAHTEDVADFGEVRVWVEDMHPKWEARKADSVVAYEPSGVMWETQVEIPLPVHVVWEALNDLELRGILSHSDRTEVQDRKDGRIGTESAFVCYHGDKQSIQTILDWRPLERVLTTTVLDLPGPRSEILGDNHLEATERGTLLRVTVALKASKAWQRAIMRATSSGPRRRAPEAMKRFAAATLERYGADRPRIELSPTLIGEQAAASLRSTE